MYQIRVYGKNRLIPWKGTHLYLFAGSPIKTDDEEMVEHLRKYHNPAEGRGISIKVIDPKPKSVRSMTADELRELADAHGVEYADSDSRMAIMNKLKEV